MADTTVRVENEVTVVRLNGPGPRGPVGATGPQGEQGPQGPAVPLSDTQPAPLGTVAPGVSTEASRSDHVHAMPTAAQVGADTSGAASAAIIAHESAPDPHPQYLLEASAAAVATSGSYGDLTGRPTLGTAAAQNVEAFATAAQGAKADTALQSETDPTVPSWAKQSTKPSYSAAEISGLGDSATRDVGTTAGTVAAGDDPRLSDARTPTAHTHPSTDISDSTATGRAVLTAADAATARTAIDAPSSAQLAGVQATAEAALPKAGGTITGAITGNVGGGTNFTQMKVDGSTFSEPVQDFVFAGRLFSNVNQPDGSTLPNCVYNIGWGIGENGAPLVAGQPALRIAFEQNFINPGDVAAYEWHLSYYDTTGYEHRPISTYLRKDGSLRRGSDMSLNNDILGFNDGQYVQKIKYDFLENNIFHVENMAYLFDVNNYPAFQQMNAAGNDYVGLPYVGSDDRLYCAQSGVAFVGHTPTTGSYANAFMKLNAFSIPDYGSALEIEASNPAGSVYATNAVINAGNGLMFSMQNVNSGANASTLLYLRTQGTTAGDAFVRYTVNGGEEWAVGVDNSDDDAFVWSHWVPGTDNRLRLSRDGNLSLPQVGGGLRVKEGNNCKQGTATLVAGTVTVANTSVTANSRIFLTGQADGGTPGFVRVSSRVPGTSFTITSSSGTDTSTVAYELFEPA